MTTSDRAVASTLRGRRVRVLTVEDFIVFKVLSTRARDLEDARAALRRSGDVVDTVVVEDEIARLAAELPDIDVRGRWDAVRDGDAS